MGNIICDFKNINLEFEPVQSNPNFISMMYKTKKKRFRQDIHFKKDPKPFIEETNVNIKDLSFKHWIIEKPGEYCNKLSESDNFDCQCDHNEINDINKGTNNQVLVNKETLEKDLTTFKCNLPLFSIVAEESDSQNSIDSEDSENENDIKSNPDSASNSPKKNYGVTPVRIYKDLKTKQLGISKKILLKKLISMGALG